MTAQRKNGYDRSPNSAFSAWSLRLRVCWPSLVSAAPLYDSSWQSTMICNCPLSRPWPLHWRSLSVFRRRWQSCRCWRRCWSWCWPPATATTWAPLRLPAAACSQATACQSGRAPCPTASACPTTPSDRENGELQSVAARDNRKVWVWE